MYVFENINEDEYSDVVSRKCWGLTFIQNTQIFILARSSRYRKHVHMRKIIKRLRQKNSGEREKKHTCSLMHIIANHKNDNSVGNTMCCVNLLTPPLLTHTLDQKKKIVRLRITFW